MAKHCILYATNERYLMPTVVSALQIRNFVATDKADVVIFLAGATADTVRASNDMLSGSKVEIVSAELKDTKRLPQLIRHSAHEFISSSYEKLLYIDSDTQVVGKVDQLLDFDLPSGKILASADPMALRIFENGRKWRLMRQYFHSVGIPEKQFGRYINSGVFLIHRSDLRTISDECLSLCSNSKPNLEFLEQDAMNIAFSDEIILMSMRWNFPAFLLNARLRADIEVPYIYHFMSDPRPWQGPFLPWGQSFYEPYSRILKAHPRLAACAVHLGKLRRLKYKAQQMGKTFLENGAWSSEPVLTRLRSLEMAAAT